MGSWYILPAHLGLYINQWGYKMVTNVFRELKVTIGNQSLFFYKLEKWNEWCKIYG